jgi:hypothetical protein
MPFRSGWLTLTGLIIDEDYNISLRALFELNAPR